MEACRSSLFTDPIMECWVHGTGHEKLQGRDKTPRERNREMARRRSRAGPKRKCPRGSGESHTAWPCHPTQPLLASHPVTASQPELSPEKKNTSYGIRKCSLWQPKGACSPAESVGGERLGLGVGVRLACPGGWKGWGGGRRGLVPQSSCCH